MLLVVVLASVASAGTAGGSFDDPQGLVVVMDGAGVQVVALQDPSQQELVAPHRVADVDVAPDERTLALAGERGVELADLETGARWSVRSGEALSVGWVPDGRWLAVSDFHGLELLDAVSGQRRPLVRTADLSVTGNCGTRPAARLIVGGVSRAGDVVVVTALDDGCDEYLNSDLYGVEVATGVVHRLSTGPGANAASMSPSQDLVVFEQSGGIVVSGVRGEDPRKLGVGGFEPRWSPDGQSVAWGSYGPSVVFISTQEGPPVQVGDAFPGQPTVAAWSPDGTALLVAGHEDGVRKAWLLHVASGERRDIEVAPLWWGEAPWLGPSVGPAVVRSGGDDRVGTAALVATRWFPAPQRHAVIARADDFADALAAGSVVAAEGGPVLLTAAAAGDSTSDAVLEQFQVEAVTIMGGTAAVHAAVEVDLAARGYRTRRIGGDDRYETAALAAEVVAERDVVLLASGQAFPDALALGPLAAAADAPILLAAADRLPAVTRDALQERLPQRLLVAGGPMALDDSVVADAERACGCTAQRLAGADRTATAVAIADELAVHTGTAPAGVFLVAGDRFPDALAAAAAAAHAGSPLLLTADRSTLGTATTAYLTEHAGLIRRIDIAGDYSVLDNNAAHAAATASTQGQRG